MVRQHDSAYVYTMSDISFLNDDTSDNIRFDPIVQREGTRKVLYNKMFHDYCCVIFILLI